MDINNLLLDLEILKQLKETDKLAITNIEDSKKLYVQRQAFYSPAVRWWYSQNRETMINYLEALVNKIENICKFIIEGNHDDEINKVGKTLRESLGGFNVLKKTYESDSLIVGRLIIIVNRLNVILENFKNYKSDNNCLINIDLNNENNDNGAN